ncbi:MAG: hypothetical protein IPI29_06505 [Ignavibacteria bacterium]|nr:hypothetical protein [Ignavibacteria bacterium]
MQHLLSSAQGSCAVLVRPGPTTISDVSDTLFSIVWPRATARNVDMGRVRVAQRKDSTVVDLVSNVTAFKLRADSIRILGANATDYRVTIENIPGTLGAPSLSRGEITFTPSGLGTRTAFCEIYVGRDTARFDITGVGVEPTLAFVRQRIDIGTSHR